MSSEQETLLISCNSELANKIHAEINKLAGTQSQITERKNFDGSTSEWIVFATLGVQALSYILDFTIRLIEIKKVSKIKVGDIEIENPTPNDIEFLQKKYKSNKRK